MAIKDTVYCAPSLFRSSVVTHFIIIYVFISMQNQLDTVTMGMARNQKFIPFQVDIDPFIHSLPVHRVALWMRFRNLFISFEFANDKIIERAIRFGLFVCLFVCWECLVSCCVMTTYALHELCISHITCAVHDLWLTSAHIGEHTVLCLIIIIEVFVIGT